MVEDLVLVLGVTGMFDVADFVATDGEDVVRCDFLNFRKNCFMC